MLRALEHMTYTQVAKKMELSVKRVKQLEYQAEQYEKSPHPFEAYLGMPWPTQIRFLTDDIRLERLSASFKEIQTRVEKITADIAKLNDIQQAGIANMEKIRLEIEALKIKSLDCNLSQTAKPESPGASQG